MEQMITRFVGAFIALVATFCVGYNTLEWVAENFEHAHKPRRWAAAALGITLYAAAMWFAISLSVCAGIAILLSLAAFLPHAIFRIGHGRVAEKKDVLCVPGWLQFLAMVASFVLFLLAFTCFRPDADHAAAFRAPFKWCIETLANPFLPVAAMAIPCWLIFCIAFVLSHLVRTFLERNWPERFLIVSTCYGKKIDWSVGLAVSIPVFLFFLNRAKF